MKKSTVFIACFLFAFMLLMAAANAYASGMCSGKDKGHGWGLEDMFFHKAGSALCNSTELGLTEEQMTKIKALKLKAKKEDIRLGADIAIIALDIDEAMHADTIDVAAVNALIDKKLALKKEEMQFFVNSYAEFKNILTKEQRDKLKEIHQSDKEKAMKCQMMGGMK